MQQVFGFSDEVATLTISLFVAGYCLGPLLWAPLSEQYGRRPIFIVSFFGYVVCHLRYHNSRHFNQSVIKCFQVGAALAKNTASILVLRLLGGIFASAPLSNSGYALTPSSHNLTPSLCIQRFDRRYLGPKGTRCGTGCLCCCSIRWPWYWPYYRRLHLTIRG